MKLSAVKPLETPAGTDVMEGARIGRIVSIDAQGVVYVSFEGNSHGPLAAKLTGAIQAKLEKENWTAFPSVLLLFEDSDPIRPVVIDIVVESTRQASSEDEISLRIEEAQDVTVDGRTVTFDAREQIVFTCGKASITLTKAGKILIRGAYLLQRSSGVNRIKGGSVQIN